MSAFLDGLSAAFDAVIQTTLQATVLAALILIVQRLLRKRLTPRWHYALWLLVLARLFLPWTPESPTSVFNYVRTEQATPTQLLLVIPDTDFVPFDGASEVGSLPSFSSQSLDAPPDAADLHLAWADWLRLLWLGVAAILVVYVCAVNGSLWWRVRREPAIDEGPAAAEFAACKEVMGVRDAIRLVRTRHVSTPALLGLLRPVLLLPESMERALSREELRHVFLHELAHYRRGDLLVNWLMVACNIVHWFNPAIWYAFYRMRADRELACDALAMNYIAPTDTSSYGRTLLRLLEHVARPRPLPGLVGVLERTSHLKKRIRGIAGFRPGSYRWSVLAVALIAMLSAVALTNASTQEMGRDAEVSAEEASSAVVMDAERKLHTDATAPTESAHQELGPMDHDLSMLLTFNLFADQDWWTDEFDIGQRLRFQESDDRRDSRLAWAMMSLSLNKPLVGEVAREQEKSGSTVFPDNTDDWTHAQASHPATSQEVSAKLSDPNSPGINGLGSREDNATQAADQSSSEIQTYSSVTPYTIEFQSFRLGRKDLGRVVVGWPEVYGVDVLYGEPRVLQVPAKFGSPRESLSGAEATELGHLLTRMTRGSAARHALSMPKGNVTLPGFDLLAYLGHAPEHRKRLAGLNEVDGYEAMPSPAFTNPAEGEFISVLPGIESQPGGVRLEVLWQSREREPGIGEEVPQHTVFVQYPVQFGEWIAITFPKTRSQHYLVFARVSEGTAGFDAASAVASSMKNAPERSAESPALPSPDTLAKLDSPVSLEFEDEHLTAITAFMDSYLGLSIELDTQVIAPKGSTPAESAAYATDGIVPYVKLADVPFKDALKALLRPLGLAYEVRGDSVYISTPDRLSHPEPGDKTQDRQKMGEMRPSAEETLLRKARNPAASATIDSSLQQACNELLSELEGSIVVLNADSGAVLAMAGSAAAESSDILHPAYQEAYPPGSLFKVLLAIAALEEGVITEETTFGCSGKFFLPGVSRPWRCWRLRYGGHGGVKVVDALAYNCDVFFYNVALKLGPEKIKEWSSRLGLGVPTGIDLPGEAVGLIPDPTWKKEVASAAGKTETWEKNWYPGETVNLGIGQGAVSTTTLQNTILMTSILNGGRRAQPFTQGDVLPMLSEPLVSEETLRIVQAGLRKCVERDKPVPTGTGKKARIAGFDILGKTGTAQVVPTVKTKNYSNEEDIPYEQRDHALFIAGVMDRSPRIAVGVFIKHGLHGSSSAAPVARAVIERFYGGNT